MQTLTEIRALLDARGIRPKHRFGQNFLHDHNQLRRLVAEAGVVPGEVVVEVGPGTGTLTEALLEQGADVIACEIDRDMQAILTERLGDRITLVMGDCLEGGRRLAAAIDEAISGRPFRLVANLPYGAASPLMAHLAIDRADCLGQFVTIQREVADRLLADPGTKAWGPLGIIIRATSRVQRIAVLSPGCFWPAPKVTSAMIAIRPDAEAPLAPGAETGAFARFVHQLFSKRRKQLGSILGRDTAMPPGVEPTMRPEVLDVHTLVSLWRLQRDP